MSIGSLQVVEYGDLSIERLIGDILYAFSVLKQSEYFIILEYVGVLAKILTKNGIELTLIQNIHSYCKKLSFK
jgi:hypothetical protein